MAAATALPKATAPPPRWRRLPGQDSQGFEEEGDDSDEEWVVVNSNEESGGRCLALKARQWRRKSYHELLAILGEKWVEASCATLVAPPMPESTDPNGGKLKRPPVTVPFASQWSGGPMGSLMTFRVERIHAPLVKDLFLSNGMRPTSGTDWLVLWSGPRLRDGIYEGLHEFQRINHFPGGTELTRKDRLWTHFNKMAKTCGEEAFDFVPKTFVLPDEAERFRAFYATSDCLWIVKPSASSQGKGIFLLKEIGDLPENHKMVVSQYVHNPLLIQGLKFDLRIYVLVTSFDPLRAYVYREGLTRFASRAYSTEPEHLGDKYRHLTNYSINKKAENFIENQRVHEDNYGHKWSLSALSRHLRHVGTDVDLMWNRINDLIVKTLLSVEPSIARRTRENLVHGNCFELYGFDVLVDEDLKPWLLEVNLSPSMQADSPLDLQVKSSVLCDTFNLVGLRNIDRQTATTSRLRSRLHFLQREADAAAAQDGSKPAFPTSIAELSEPDLKMMALALDEMDRARNFIRLYPTRRTLKSYEPITRNRRPQEAYRAQLLASLLYGPLLDGAPGQTRQVLPGSVPAASRADADGEDVDRENGNHGDARNYQSGAGDAVDVASAAAGAHSPDLAAAALRIVGILGTRQSFRLILMEYLVRVVSACAKASAEDRESLQRTKAIRTLKAFRQQLALFVRVRASQGQLPQNGRSPDESSDPVDRLASMAQAVLGLLATEMWGSGTAPSDRPNLEKVGQFMTLAQCAPASFMQSVSGQRALLAMSGLSAADLESILRSPQSISELGPMLEDPRDLDEMVEVDAADAHNPRLLLSGTMAGPVTELHNAASSLYGPAAAVAAASGASHAAALTTGSASRAAGVAAGTGSATSAGTPTDKAYPQKFPPGASPPPPRSSPISPGPGAGPGSATSSHFQHPPRPPLAPGAFPAGGVTKSTLRSSLPSVGGATSPRSRSQQLPFRKDHPLLSATVSGGASQRARSSLRMAKSAPALPPLSAGLSAGVPRMETSNSRSNLLFDPCKNQVIPAPDRVAPAAPATSFEHQVFGRFF